MSPSSSGLTKVPGMTKTERERARLEAAKQQSTLQLLVRCGRLANERAIAQVNASGRARFRPALANLFPHIAYEGTRITELARRVGVTKQAVAPLVAELEAEGVVRVVPDPSDGRARLVKFTVHGLKEMQRGMEVFRALEASFAKELGAKRMAALHDALAALLEVLERPEAP